MLSYANLEEFADGFFSGMKPKPDQNFQVNSKITTVTVSNNDTSQLSEPVILTFHHLKQVQRCLLQEFPFLQECFESFYNYFVHRQTNRTTPVCSGIPLRTEGRGLPVAAAPWTQTLNTLCAPAAT